MLTYDRPAPRETTIAAVAMHCSHDPAANWAKYEGFIEEAALQGVDYIVFPEVSLQGYLLSSGGLGSAEMNEQIAYFRATAETVPGPTTRKLQLLAKRHGMLIQAGMAERTMDGNIVYNSAVLVDGSGVLGVFRKLHNQFEWPVFSPGNHLDVFPTALGKVGMFICYDLAFPEVTREFALKGAKIAALTTAWPMKGDDPETDYYGYSYDLFSRSSALANQMWLVCSNQVKRPVTPGAANYYGHSRIVGPNGKILADTGYAEGLAVATVDIDAGLEHARTREFFGLNLLQDRRPAYYQLHGSQEIYYAPDSAAPFAGDGNAYREEPASLAGQGVGGAPREA